MTITETPYGITVHTIKLFQPYRCLIVYTICLSHVSGKRLDIRSPNFEILLNLGIVVSNNSCSRTIRELFIAYLFSLDDDICS